MSEKDSEKATPEKTVKGSIEKKLPPKNPLQKRK
jgi:hypothetical protein